MTNEEFTNIDACLGVSRSLLLLQSRSLLHYTVSYNAPTPHRSTALQNTDFQYPITSQMSVAVLWPFTSHNEHWHAVNSSSRIQFDSCSCRSRGSERVNEQCQSVFSMLSREVLRSLARRRHGRWLSALFCVIGASTAAADISCDDQSVTGWELAFMSATWQHGHRLPLSKLGGSRLQGWVLL